MQIQAICVVLKLILAATKTRKCLNQLAYGEDYDYDKLLEDSERSNNSIRGVQPEASTDTIGAVSNVTNNGPNLLNNGEGSTDARSDHLISLPFESKGAEPDSCQVDTEDKWQTPFTQEHHTQEGSTVETREDNSLPCVSTQIQTMMLAMLEDFNSRKQNISIFYNRKDSGSHRSL